MAEAHGTCVVCGKATHRPEGRRGPLPSTCSKTCSNRRRYLKLIAQETPEQREKRKARVAKAVRTFTARAKAQGRPLHVKHDYAIGSCTVCGKVVPAKRLQSGHVGKPGRYCSRSCRNRVSRAKRVAIERQGDFINPYSVFIADRWTCYLCGKHTPKALRGTSHKDAPELEHVMPLSKGGTHTRSNVRCACRECNSRKASKMPSPSVTGGGRSASLGI